MQLDPNFSELLASLRAHDVRYLVVGGYAVALHGHPRYTGDLDVWLWIDAVNASRVVAALEEFGFGGVGLVPEDFLQPEHVVQLGYPPLRVDLLTTLDGVDFEQSWLRRQEVEVGGAQVPFIGRADLLRNKRASGRPQDLADLDALDPLGPTESRDPHG